MSAEKHGVILDGADVKRIREALDSMRGDYPKVADEIRWVLDSASYSCHKCPPDCMEEPAECIECGRVESAAVGHIPARVLVMVEDGYRCEDCDDCERFRAAARSSRCHVCLADATPDNPVNVKVEGEDGDELWVCFDGEACQARIEEEIEAAGA